MKRNKIDRKEKKYSPNKAGLMNKSIKNQILVPFLILIILTGGIVAAVSYISSVRNTTDVLTENIKVQMGAMNNTFEMFFTNINSILDRYSSNDLLTFYQDKNRLQLFEYLGETGETNDSIVNIYTAVGNDKEMIIYPNVDLGDDYDAGERVWYQDAVSAEGESVWTEPYVDAATGEMIVTAAKAYYNGSQLAGVMAADVYVQTLVDMVNEIEIGETGYGVMFDQKGKYAAHPNSELVGQDASGEEYYKKAVSAGEQGIISFKDDGNHVMGFVKNPTTNWLIGGVVNEKDFQKQAQATLVPITITLVIVLILAIFIALNTTKGITNPIQKITTRMGKISTGDLSDKPLEIKSKNEIGQLVKATNEMGQNMRELLIQINGVSETVSSQSASLTQSANEVKTGTEQVAATMEELATGTETQANSASDLASIMNTFAVKVDEANENGEHIEKNSEKVLNLTTKGSQLMGSSTDQMKKIDAIVKDAVDKMQNLDNQSKEITRLVSVIKDVADQTNLLALNAAIEAARAGEHGKGFAVVADEVRKLAEQVALSVNDITAIVTNIQNESGAVSDSLKEGYNEVERGTAQIEITNETFTDISSSLTEMVQNIKDVSSNLSEIAANSQEMSSSVEEIASVAEEAAAGVEQTAASAEESSSSMEEVARSSEQLAKLAEELNGQVGRFKL